MKIKSKLSELLKIIDAMSGIKITVIGDIILDQYIWGDVARISPEAPVPVVEVKKIEDRLGGAANVAMNLANMGACVSLVGVVGDDNAAAITREIAANNNINTKGILADSERPTSIKTRVIASKQQIVRIDQELKGACRSELSRQISEIVAAGIVDSSAVIVSDYGKGAITKELMAQLSDACESGLLSFKNKPLVVDPHPASYSFYKKISIVKPNRKEAEKATGIMIVDQESAIAAAQALILKWHSDLALITLGEDGLLLVFADGRKPIIRPTVARSVFDVSGAGDTVTAIFSLALAAGAEPDLAGDIANAAAGVVVSQVGTAAVTKERLIGALKENYD